MSRCRASAKLRTAVATVGVIVERPAQLCPSQPAARSLNVRLRPFLMPSNSGAQWAHRGSESDPGLSELLDFARTCDVVTLGSSQLSPTRFESLVRAGVTIRPHHRAMELERNPTAALEILRRSGFSVTSTPGRPRVEIRPHHLHHVSRADKGDFAATDSVGNSQSADSLTVVLARRPAGQVVTYPVINSLRRFGNSTRQRHRYEATEQEAVETAVSIVNGFDLTGVANVAFDLVGTRPHVRGIAIGPKAALTDHATVSLYDNHLRGLLDWPLTPPKAMGCRVVRR